MKSRNMALVGVSLMGTVLMLTACTTLDPYTGEERTARAQRQAMIGAAAGAAAGALTGDSSRDRRKRALIGAGVGALAGAAVGNYMDRQEAQLRVQLENTGVGVTRIGDEIVLNMPGNITFATNSADLNASFFEVLDSVAIVVNEFDQTVIEVAGHTDSTGAFAYNQSLSERRAASVATYLRTRSVRTDRMIQIGHGPAVPIASNETVAGRQLNRRVELTLVPLTEG